MELVFAVSEFYCFVVVLVVVLLLLLAVLKFELVASLTAVPISFEFCSNVFAALTLRLDRCFELSFACCNTVFHESIFENMMLFERVR